MPTTGNFASLLVSPPRSLKLLRMRISNFTLNTMPLLAEELQMITNTAGHFIRYLSVNICMDETTGSQIQDIPWSLIVKVLLAPGNWPSLQTFLLRQYVSSKQPVDKGPFIKACDNILEFQLHELFSEERKKFDSIVTFSPNPGRHLDDDLDITL